MARTLEEVEAAHPVNDPAAYAKAYAEATLASELAGLVYTLRTEAGLTQTELAQRMGTSQSSIARIENSGTVPTLELLDRLGRALDTRLRLIADHGPGTPQQEVAVELGARNLSQQAA